MDFPAPVSPVRAVKPALELEFDGLDDREVANLQVSEHRALQSAGGWPPVPLRPQCSFERRMRK